VNWVEAKEKSRMFVCVCVCVRERERERERRQTDRNEVQTITTSLKTSRLQTPLTTVPRFVPQKCVIKEFTENQNVYTNRAAWHAKVDWKEWGAWHGSVVSSARWWNNEAFRNSGMLCYYKPRLYSGQQPDKWLENWKITGLFFGESRGFSFSKAPKITMGTFMPLAQVESGPFSEAKRSGHDARQHFHLVPKGKKDYSYNSLRRWRIILCCTAQYLSTKDAVYIRVTAPLHWHCAPTVHCRPACCKQEECS